MEIQVRLFVESLLICTRKRIRASESIDDGEGGQDGILFVDLDAA